MNNLYVKTVLTLIAITTCTLAFQSNLSIMSAYAAPTKKTVEYGVMFETVSGARQLEQQMNVAAANGWRVKNIAVSGQGNAFDTMAVLLEREY